MAKQLHKSKARVPTRKKQHKPHGGKKGAQTSNRKRGIDIVAEGEINRVLRNFGTGADW
jgi:hypothetical protein